MSEPSDARREARTKRAADAFHADFLGGRNVAILYAGHDAHYGRARLENAIRSALDAADAVSEPTPPCRDTVRGFNDVLLVCDLPNGHNGAHYQASGATWMNGLTAPSLGAPERVVSLKKCWSSDGSG